MLRMSLKEARKLGLTGSQANRTVTKGPKNRARMFEMVCKSLGLPEPIAEYKFAADMEYRADYAFVGEDVRVLLEIDGGIYGTGTVCPVCGRSGPGGHSSIAGIKRDIAKYNLAVSLGWRVVRCLPEDISSGEIFALLKRIIK